MNTITEMPENRNVIITDNYKYSAGFKGTKGIIVRVTPEGCNVWSNINSGGNYEDMIYWFPFHCIEQINS